MMGLVMAGGRGLRMKSENEKLLLCYKKPLVMHVIDALCDSGCFENVFAATSPNSPKTRHYLLQNNIKTIQTRGEGYAKDLNYILQQTDDSVLVVSGDMPFLDSAMIRHLVAGYDSGNTWTSFLVRQTFLESLGLESEFCTSIWGDDCVYTGISVINAKNVNNADSVQENHIILDDKRIAFNLNTKSDCDLIDTA